MIIIKEAEQCYYYFDLICFKHFVIYIEHNKFKLFQHFKIALIVFFLIYSLNVRIFITIQKANNLPDSRLNQKYKYNFI